MTVLSHQLSSIREAIKTKTKNVVKIFKNCQSQIYRDTRKIIKTRDKNNDEFYTEIHWFVFTHFRIDELH